MQAVPLKPNIQTELLGRYITPFLDSDMLYIVLVVAIDPNIEQVQPTSIHDPEKLAQLHKANVSN